MMKKMLRALILALFFAPLISLASTTYDFQSDTNAATPANTTVVSGTVVASTTALGKALLATVKSGEIASILFDSFASSTDYSVVWQHGYTANTGADGFILRAQSTSMTFAGHTGARLGYLFQLNGASTVYIWRVDVGGFNMLYSGTLAKSNPRYFRAMVVGTSQGFDYSSDGITWTHISTTTDATYTSGVTQYTAGYGVAVGTDYIDNITYTNLSNTPPTVSSFTPADNATGVATTSNLTIVFSEAVSTSTGSLYLRKVSDDSSLPYVMTGGGTNTITINPSSDFTESAGYYVTIDATAFKNANNVNYAGISASSTWNFTAGDFTAPTFSAISGSSTASTTASIIWTTNEAASTKVLYGTTQSYGSTTIESATTTRVTSHQDTLSNLVPCATYYYVVVSRDTSLNAATSSSANTFTTSGCAGGATQISATSTPVTVSAGGSTTLTESNTTITVTAPSNFTSTSSSVVIQIQSLSGGTVLGSLGTPSGWSGAGNTVFDVKAIIDSHTTLDSFNSPVTISYQYSDSDISGLNESTLQLYHYHDGAWSTLTSCSVDTGANTITCTTPSFSIFSLFGQTQSSSGSRNSSGTTLQRRLTTLSTTEKKVTSILPVRDLQLSDEGDDVKSLQEFLINKNSGVAALELKRVGATGYFGRYTQSALSEYQKANNIYPYAGYFGPITRAKMK